MIEINSPKIDNELLKIEIEKNIESFDPSTKVKKRRNKKMENLDPSLKEHYSKIYKILKRVEHFLLVIGLSKLVHIIKKPLTSVNFKRSNVFLVSDFTKYDDEEFIKNIYRGILKREVDGFSLDYYLEQLRSGIKSKGEILAIIRFSKEGRVYNVPILGIKKRYIMAVLYKIPLLSYAVKSVIALLTLPKILRKYNSLEANYLMNNINVTKEIAKKANITDYLDDIHTLEENFSKKHESINLQIEEILNSQTSLEEELKTSQNNVQKQLELYMSDVNNAKSYLREVESNLKSLMTNIENSIDGKEVLDKKMFQETLAETEHFLDSFYISFEDKFRGSREDIKQRQEYYLPLVKDVLINESELVLDVGCGRGEWIELLKDNNIQAKGVDLNRLMVKKSQEYGLDTTMMDAIAYLKGLKAGSLSVVTGFHIVEHLPFEVLIALFDESLRVLKKGGMIIFETPNPENLLVGSCTFYTDPTHINPIPPVTLEFLASNRGFSNINIHRLHPIKEPQYIEGLDRDDVNNLIYASTKEQDYSVVGYK